MVAAFDNAQGLLEKLSDPRINAVAIGPGAGGRQETRELVAATLASEERLRCSTPTALPLSAKIRQNSLS